MNVIERLKEIERDDYQGFMSEIFDAWALQMKIVNNTLSTMLFDSDIADISEDSFENHIESLLPSIENGIAYFICAKRYGGEDWKVSRIGIPEKIWWRFLYKPKSTFVTYRMIY